MKSQLSWRRLRWSLASCAVVGLMALSGCTGGDAVDGDQPAPSEQSTTDTGGTSSDGSPESEGSTDFDATTESGSSNDADVDPGTETATETDTEAETDDGDEQDPVEPDQQEPAQPIQIQMPVLDAPAPPLLTDWLESEEAIDCEAGVEPPALEDWTCAEGWVALEDPEFGITRCEPPADEDFFEPCPAGEWNANLPPEGDGVAVVWVDDDAPEGGHGRTP